MGDSQFFKTLEVVDKINNGNSEVIRQKLEWKTNGYKKHIINNEDGILITEITIESDNSKVIKNYKVAGDTSYLFYEETITKDGTKTITNYVGDSSLNKKSEYVYGDDGYFKKTIWNPPGTNDCYVLETDSSGNTNQTIKNASGSQVLKETRNNQGQVELNLGTGGEISINLDGSSGNVSINAKGNSTVTVDGSSTVEVGSDSTVNVTGNSTLIAGGNITATASSAINITASSVVTIAAPTANVNAGVINLSGKTNCGGGGPAVARLGDATEHTCAYTGIPITGEITEGASNTFAG
jgi:hypothetical protein